MPKNQLIVGAACGAFATFAIGPVDRLMTYFIPASQKRREHSLRDGSPHQVAGRLIGESMLSRHLKKSEAKGAQLLFSLSYGLIWGAVFSGLRKKFPVLSKGYSAPYGLGFFLVCDGLLAPLLRFSPPVSRLPWQFNVKEAMNHVVWNAICESVQRYYESHPSKRENVIAV